MSEEMEKDQNQSVGQNGNSREGYSPVGQSGYQKDYRVGSRPQRPRIHNQRAYSSEKQTVMTKADSVRRALEQVSRVEPAAHISRPDTVHVTMPVAISHVRAVISLVRVAISSVLTTAIVLVTTIIRREKKVDSSLVRAAISLVEVISHVKADITTSVAAISSVAVTTSAVAISRAVIANTRQDIIRMRSTA